MDDVKKVLVTGATGKQGGAVARVLVERGHSVRALTRDVDKPEAEELRGLGVEVVRGDFKDPASVQGAMLGMETVYLMATPYEQSPEAETREASDAAEAARQAGVRHLVYSSVANADKRTGIPHFESKRVVEERLTRSTVPYTIIAPVFWMENMLAPPMLPGLATGRIAMPLSPSRKLQMIGLQELARFASDVIEHPERFEGARVDIASDAVTMEDVAATLSRVAAKRMTYEEIPKEAARRTMGDDTTRMYEWFERVGYSVDIAKLRREHPDVGWRTFDEWASAQDWTFLTPAAAVHAS